MKATLTVTSRGVVTLPAKLRAALGLKPDDHLIAETPLARLRTGPIHAPDPALEDALPLPEKDRPVLAAAIRHGCEALVTGDRTHFGRLYGKAIHGVTIHSPRSIAETLLAHARPAPKVLRQPRKRYAVGARRARLRVPGKKDRQ